MDWVIPRKEGYMKNIKITLLLLILSLGALFAYNTALAGDSIQVFINGEEVFFENSLTVESNTVLAPAGELGKLLGMEVQWKPKEKVVYMKKGSKSFKFTMGKALYTLNDMYAATSATPKIINDAAYVPVHDVSKNAGFKVEWDSKNKILKLTDPTKVTTTQTTTVTTTQATTVAQTTKAETTTETTTFNAMMQSPVAGVSKRLSDTVYKDLKTAITGYSIGNSEGNNRFKANNIKKLTANWDAIAKSKEDQQYVKTAKAFYNALAKRLKEKDKWYKEKTTARKADMQKFKEKITLLVNQYSSCRSIDEITALTAKVSKA